MISLLWGEVRGTLGSRGTTGEGVGESALGWGESGKGGPWRGGARARGGASGERPGGKGRPGGEAP